MAQRAFTHFTLGSADNARRVLRAFNDDDDDVRRRTGGGQNPLGMRFMGLEKR
jgi:hypothetical protein